MNAHLKTIFHDFVAPVLIFGIPLIMSSHSGVLDFTVSGILNLIYQKTVNFYNFR